MSYCSRALQCNASSIDNVNDLNDGNYNIPKCMDLDIILTILCIFLCVNFEDMY